LKNLTYSEPALYDLAFSYRDYKYEVAALNRWFKIINRTASVPNSVLELACGPGRHILEFSRVGIPGVGVDVSSDMFRHARWLSAQQSASTEIIITDMSEFELSRRFDLVMLLINSVCHIPDEYSLISHLKSVSRHLSNSGVYIIEAACHGQIVEAGESEWCEESGQDKVNICWSWDQDFDYVQMRGHIGDREIDIDEKFPMRRWRTQELVSIAETVGLKLIGHYGEFDDEYSSALRMSRKFESKTTMQCCLAFVNSITEESCWSKRHNQR